MDYVPALLSVLASLLGIIAFKILLMPMMKTLSQGGKFTVQGSVSVKVDPPQTDHGP
jgi:hypothetical protein